jgi:hypothetical protein
MENTMIESSNNLIDKNIEDNKYSKEKKVSLKGKSGGTLLSENNKLLNQKQELLKQFDPHLKEQLLAHVWNVISYNPLKFYIADSQQKQIIISTIKKEKIKQYDSNLDISLLREFQSLCPTKIIIEANL